MTTWIYTRTDELQHHGIKGQRWGVRRFQNKDGSLTPAGRRRYDEPNKGRKSNGERITVEGQTFKVYGNRSSNKSYVDKIEKKAKNMGYKVERESKPNTQKPKEHTIPKNKSMHRLQLEEKYRKEGLSPKEAEQAAAKRIKSEAIVAGAAALTVGACVAYAKYKGYTTDKVFKADSEFQRIMRLADNAEIKEGRQYIAFHEGDKQKYKGILGDTFKRAIDRENQVNKYADMEAITDKVYDVTVKNKDEIRVASEKKARDTFAKLYGENPHFRQGVKKAIRDQGPAFAGLNGKLQGVVDKAQRREKFSDREIHGKLYDLFNVMLMDKTPQGVKNADMFYEAIRKTGVNAIIDVNDKKYSGYKAKLPIITIDGKFDYSKRVMENAEIQENMKKAYAKIWAPQLMIMGASYAAAVASEPVVRKYNVDKRVLEYKNQHPNTKMSDAEIKAMVEEQIKKEEDEWK